MGRGQWDGHQQDSLIISRILVRVVCVLSNQDVWPLDLELLLPKEKQMEKKKVEENFGIAIIVGQISKQ